MEITSKPIRKGTPTFKIFTAYVANLPHCVTLRPVAIPGNTVSHLFISAQIIRELKREVHRVVGLLRPQWAPTTINSRVSIVLNATNLTGGGAQTLDRYTSLRDLRADDILRIVSKVEYADVTIYDLEWRLTIVSIFSSTRNLTYAILVPRQHHGWLWNKCHRPSSLLQSNKIQRNLVGSIL